MPTFMLTLDAARDAADDLAADLFERGASGVEVRDGEAAPMPGVAPPPPGRAVLVAFFEAREDADLAREDLGGEVGTVPDRDWNEEWKKGLGPLAIGRAYVRPSWVDAPVPAGMAEIVLDPGMAFGTGTHPTTSLCLAALSDLLAAHPGASVLDVGTGSGLLAIGARKLGAGKVAGNDDDPVAVRVARENAALNGVAAAIELTDAPVEEVAGCFDVVVANILANTLVALAPALRAKTAPGGTILLSGILAPQAEEVAAAYRALGLEAAGERRDAEWVMLAFRRPA